MRRSLRFPVACGVVMALGLVGCAAEASPEPPEKVVLSVADGFSEKHPIGAGTIQPFLKYLEEHGGPVGIEIRRFPPGAVGSTKDHLTLMRTGVVDLGQVVPSNQPAELPLSAVADLPGISEDPCAALDALTPMMQEGGVLYEEEIKTTGVRPLFTTPVVGYEVVTADKKVEKPGDVRGELLRSAGGISDQALKQLGAAPVAIQASEIYEAVSRGTVAGALLAPLSVPEYGLEDVAGYATEGVDLLTLTSGFGISIETWEGLSPEQRGVFDEASRLAQTEGCQAQVEAGEKANKVLRDAGVELVEITPEEREEWVELMKPVHENWISELEQRGKPAREVYEEFVRRLEQEQS
jgi:TRAP-type C4-dicarboxylate transport system substrate-binding protein